MSKGFQRIIMETIQQNVKPHDYGYLKHCKNMPQFNNRFTLPIKTEFQSYLFNKDPRIFLLLLLTLSQTDLDLPK